MNYVSRARQRARDTCGIRTKQLTSAESDLNKSPQWDQTKPVTSVGPETTSLRAGTSKRPQLEHSRTAEWPPLMLKDLLESWVTSRVTRTMTMRNNHLILESGFSQFHFDLIPYCVWLYYIVGLWEWANSALTFLWGIRELKED